MQVNTNSTFSAAFKTFFDSAKRLVERESDNTLTAQRGRKYIKIVMRRKNQIEGGSAWAFISLDGGAILKPASWSRPAKYSRGNIFNSSNGLKSITWTGPMYLK